MKFRFKALQRQREPDELDTPTRLAAPRAWAALLVTFAVVAGAGAWSVVGRLPQNLSASGVLVHPLGVSALQSEYAGLVSRVLVAPGDSVTTGQDVADITDPTGAVRTVRSPFSGLVAGAPVATGQAVRPGSTVLTVERTDGPDDRLVAMLFLPSSQALAVTPGEPVDLSVSTLPSQAYGLLRGQVTTVGRYPLSAADASALLGGNAALAGLSGTGSYTEVLVDLLRNPSTASGYAWSTSAGAPMPLGSLVQVTGSINLGSQRPISLVLGS
ncbi:HlyD family efflux transporter periplasmic adaptor subunit [Streptacidiphilus sp. EB129]|uniref:HlyD family efflux transporter periplasmic adaptor subunit n=1 Tax=Streptacidiphilus sp. EB129 TaxID=3156262 RepID=UPI003517B81D